jgi:hypothetical protein
MDVPLVKDLGLGLSAVFCGVVAIINGKDKVNKTDCEKCKVSLDNRLKNGDVAFAHIEEQLKPIPGMQKDIKKIQMTLVAISTKMRISIPEADDNV